MVSIALRNRNIALLLSTSLTLLGPASVYATPSETDTSNSKTAGSSADGDIFGTQKWSIVPAGSVTDPARHSPEKTPSISPRGMETSVQSGKMGAAPNISTVTEPAPIKLYGRIEELSTSAGAKIPLKMQAMTPIRDASLDAKVAVKPVRLPGQATWLHPTTSLTAKADQNSQPSYPTDYRGTWSGDMIVQLVDFDKSFFEFDRAEAAQQQRLVTRGRQGRCSVTFYQGNNDKVEMQPTQIVFSAPLNTAVQEMAQGSSTIAALAGMLGGMGNNPMLANMNMQIPEFSLPLGSMTSGQGVTENQLNAELMKNTLKEIAKGVLEQQVVTRDSDRKKSGEVKITFTESDLRFTRVNSSRLSLQAAAVSYDSQGKYLNKVILTGMLDKGAPEANANPSQLQLFGDPAQGGGASPFGGGGASPFGGGGASPFGGGGASPFGGGGFGNSPLFGGQGAGPGGAPGNMVDQMQQVQKMLKEMDGQ